jgi:DNA repair protein RadC
MDLKIMMVKEEHKVLKRVDSSHAVYRAYKYLSENSQEELHILALDAKNRVVGDYMVSRGTATSSPFHPREIFKFACLKNAQSIIMVHNHPSGDLLPSQEDAEITKRLVKAGDIMGINLLDHIIIGDNGFYSFREHSPLEFSNVVYI